jgi:hypothetical protein
MPYHIFFQQYYYCIVRYIIIETKEFARILLQTIYTMDLTHELI